MHLKDRGISHVSKLVVFETWFACLEDAGNGNVSCFLVRLYYRIGSREVNARF